MAQLILLLGGNEGEVKENIKKANILLQLKLGTTVKMSSLYESEPWGFEHALPFLNQVIEIETQLLPNEILEVTQQIEKVLGRREKTKSEYEGRSMDIDLLFYDNQKVSEPHLVIPHPRLHERMFTLMPLNECWGALVHPRLNVPISSLLYECKDKGWVRKL